MIKNCVLPAQTRLSTEAAPVFVQTYDAPSPSEEPTTPTTISQYIPSGINFLDDGIHQNAVDVEDMSEQAMQLLLMTPPQPTAPLVTVPPPPPPVQEPNVLMQQYDAAENPFRGEPGIRFTNGSDLEKAEYAEMIRDYPVNTEAPAPLPVIQPAEDMVTVPPPSLIVAPVADDIQQPVRTGIHSYRSLREHSFSVK